MSAGSSPPEFSLLRTFRGLFEGKKYQHRNSTLGDLVANQLYEDLAVLARSEKFVWRVRERQCVVNLGNKTIGRESRRGDGTLGELVPSAAALDQPGQSVACGPIANIQIGAETKILAKAMIKQIDRVIGDLERQVAEFQRTGGQPICVGIVGINSASAYTSFEGKTEWPTDGKRHKHPIQEATEAEVRVKARAAPHFDEFLFLRFRATNTPPLTFEWVDQAKTAIEYGAMLLRVSRLYDQRF